MWQIICTSKKKNLYQVAFTRKYEHTCTHKMASSDWCSQNFDVSSRVHNYYYSPDLPLTYTNNKVSLVTSATLSFLLKKIIPLFRCIVHTSTNLRYFFVFFACVHVNVNNKKKKLHSHKTRENYSAKYMSFIRQN